MIYVGIDDTDTLETQGTNQLARMVVGRLSPTHVMILRHQLFLDPRVPYTSHNGSASILLAGSLRGSIEQLVALLQHAIQSWYVEGSDPGLCVATHVPQAVVEFGVRCQSAIVTQGEARNLAASHGIYLEGLGGNEQGVIGALAAVGLAATGENGRVIHLDGWPWPDDLCGLQDVSALYARGVDEIRCAETDEPVTQGLVDIGKRLRPNRHRGRIVLYVAPAPETWPAPPYWHAVLHPSVRVESSR